MGAVRVMRRDLPEASGLSPPDVLRLLRRDPHPVALTGAWAGSGAVLGSAPVQVVERHAAGAPGSAGALALPPLSDGLTAPAGDGAARFGGGWIGYLGYGFAGWLHTLPPAPGGPRRLPDCWFGRYDNVLVQDPCTGDWVFEALLGPADDRVERAAIAARLAELTARIRAVTSRDARMPDSPPYQCGDFELTPAAAEHRQAVARAVGLIEAGDMFQANITLRLEAACTGDPLDMFCAGVERLKPPYAAFLRMSDDQAVASFSPELFLRRTGTTVRSSPIKGTSERSDAPATADDQRRELSASAKNRAENVMIVDLMRSDLSRVCRPGSVIVPRLAAAQPHPGVWHLVSDVRGELASGQTDLDLIAATFPPGSVTGAPKVRAMEVIAELEAVPREAYTGAIGYRSPVAGLELNVAIRTFEFAAGRVWLGAGGGIVAASDPAAEFAECLVKARPLIAAIGGGFGGAGRSEPAASARAAAVTLWPRPAAGIVTALRVCQGEPDGLAAHLARLAASARALYGKELPPGLASQLSGCLDRGGSGRLRITVKPVGGPLQCQVDFDRSGPWPLDGPGARLRTVWLPDQLAGLGQHQWADRRLLCQLAARSELGPDEQLLLLDAAGEVLETDRANVFAVIGGVLRTPAADGRILPGVTRARVLAAARDEGLPVVAGSLTAAELLAASEVFVTSAVQGLLPVLAADGRPGGWQPGPAGIRLARALHDGRPPADYQAAGAELAARPGATRRQAVARRDAAGLVLVIDNYDSFTYNLVHLLGAAGAQVEVVRNDEVTAAQVVALGATALVISPGPGAPADAGVCIDVVRALDGSTPVLGVCLGHQAIAVAYGGRVERVKPRHGQASRVQHDGLGIFAGLPSSFPAARYHSLLVAAELPASLSVTARTSDGLPMAIRHRRHPVDGVQFHPESILTATGARLIGNFLRSARLRAG